MALFPVFGKAPSGARLERIHQSAGYAEGGFQNPVPTDVTLKDASFVGMLWKFFNKPSDTVPPKPLPSVHTDLQHLPSGQPLIVWFGHSSYLLKVDNFHMLVDPVFSGNASPFSFFAKAFPGADAYGVEDLPFLDVVLLTHDHYDHLDYKTVTQLERKTARFVTSLGVGAHLEYWGVDPAKITELDWLEETALPMGSLTATPARHFSGRSFKRGQTLWSSFVLKIAGHNLFLGGDSGYGPHFKKIGDQYGPFELAILECGQYGENWPYIHTTPEETVKAAQDLHAALLLPVHWAKFSLSLHPWNEPVRRVVKAAAAAGMNITTPKIGEVVQLGGNLPHEAWWE